MHPQIICHNDDQYFSFYLSIQIPDQITTDWRRISQDMNGIKDQLPEKNLKGNFKEAVPQKITYSLFK